ncbi:MAG TPA: GPR1/FUN34/YaaH family transporter [Acidobacteriaceae bacterium]|nr:GPR1/FUN34/YaaH family transporter [Acidobacteriaceae bacterium]
MASATTMPLRETREETGPSAQIYLQPIAAPSILGLYAFAGATFMVAAHMAHWFGGTLTDLYLAPFAALFGGLAQFTAGMWSFKARDGVATAMHGMWGSFWMAFGLLELAFLHGSLSQPAGAFPALGYWFIVLAAITWVLMVAAYTESKALSLLLGFLAAGSTAAAIGYMTGAEWLNILAGYLLIVSALVAWYAGSELLLKGAFRRTGTGEAERVRTEPMLVAGRGEPGVIRGQ